MVKIRNYHVIDSIEVAPQELVDKINGKKHTERNNP